MALWRPSSGRALLMFLCLFAISVLFLLYSQTTLPEGLKTIYRISRIADFRDDTRTVEVEFPPAVHKQDDNIGAVDSHEGNDREGSSDSDREMFMRHETLEKRCPKGKLNATWDVRRHTLYNYRYMFSHCFVPKVGCTFWKSIFHYLDIPGITPEEFTDRLLHERKAYVHGIKLPFLSSLSGTDLVAFARKATTVVFARNPYTRLFSAYVDKFVRPLLWKQFGKVIVERFRPDATNKSLNCGHDVTFEEFLRYVVDVGTTGNFISSVLDDHWTPVSSLCGVCEISYDYVGKQETFPRDRDYILEKLGVNELITTRISLNDTSEDAMNSMLLSRWWSPNLSECASFTEMFNRLWLVFQIRGYIPFDVHPPLDRGIRSDMNITEIQKIVMNVFKEGGTPSEGHSHQRHQALINAYRNVSLGVKMGIQKIFKYDFELFDYEIEPAELYS